MLNDIHLFIHVAEAGSLKLAAEQLQLPLPTVSRRMNKLEQQLKCLLFKRSTRGLTLTTEGELYYQSCVWHIRELKSTLNNVDKSLHSLEGSLHVLAPPNLALKPLQNFWTEFTQRYPSIKLRLDLDIKMLDFNQVPADLAIRVGELPSSGLIQTKLGFIPSILVAAPASISKREPPQKIEDLHQHPTIMVLNKAWNLKPKFENSHPSYLLQKSHHYHTNDISFASHLAQIGAGLALLPLSEVSAQLERGQLMHVLPDWEGDKRLVSIIRASRHHYSVRAQCFHHEFSNFIKQKNWINII